MKQGAQAEVGTLKQELGGEHDTATAAQRQVEQLADRVDELNTQLAATQAQLSTATEQLGVAAKVQERAARVKVRPLSSPESALPSGLPQTARARMRGGVRG